MDVVTAGRNPVNPAGLIASDRMRAMIVQARESHDLIVLDTPPVPVISDAIPLLREVDGVIVVSYLGVSTRDAVSASSPSCATSTSTYSDWWPTGHHAVSCTRTGS